VSNSNRVAASQASGNRGTLPIALKYGAVIEEQRMDPEVLGNLLGFG
jgi:hypothetical protein